MGLTEKLVELLAKDETIKNAILGAIKDKTLDLDFDSTGDELTIVITIRKKAP